MNYDVSKNGIPQPTFSDQLWRHRSSALHPLTAQKSWNFMSSNQANFWTVHWYSIHASYDKVKQWRIWQLESLKQGILSDHAATSVIHHHFSRRQNSDAVIIIPTFIWDETTVARSNQHLRTCNSSADDPASAEAHSILNLGCTWKHSADNSIHSKHCHSKLQQPNSIFITTITTPHSQKVWLDKNK